jgi:hypothetical protein
MFNKINLNAKHNNNNKMKKKTYLNNDHFKKWMTSSNQNASTSNQIKKQQ